MNGPYAVLGAGVWTPTQTSLHAYLAGTQSEPGARPEATLLPARMRGRASLLTAMLANVVQQATADYVALRETAPTVYGSAYGEMTTTLALLEQLHGEDGRLSPAKFQASVHNTAGGQLSIALGNRSCSTSLAAGRATVAMAIMEACAYLEERPGAVLIACADESAPEPLEPSASYAPLALALLLTNRPGAGPVRARLGASWSPQLTAADSANIASENPCAPGLPLVRALCAAQPTYVRLPAGAGADLVIEVQPP